MINGIYRTSPPPAVAYELKTCELCARNFTRQVGTQIKYCGPCLAKSADGDETIWMEEEHRRKKPPKKASQKTEARRGSRENGAVEELRTAWLKSIAVKEDPASEIRDAWNLH